MVTLVIDISWTKPPPNMVCQAGYQGVIGYVSRDTSKTLDKTSMNNYLSAGLGVAFVFEDTARRPLLGANAGQADGIFTATFLQDVGLPKTCPVYVAVDFDVQSTEIPVVLEYLRGFASTVNREIRVYGGYKIVDAAVNAGFNRPWQTEAWSNNQTHPKTVMLQRAKPTRLIPGFEGKYDENLVFGTLSDAGFWQRLTPVSIVSESPLTVNPVMVSTISGHRKGDDGMFLVHDDKSSTIYLFASGRLYHVASMSDFQALQKAVPYIGAVSSDTLKQFPGYGG